MAPRSVPALLLGCALVLSACATDPSSHGRVCATPCAGEASFGDRFAAWVARLQNPRYPGNANRDLVPYQARNRDVADCSSAAMRGILTRAKAAAAAGHDPEAAAVQPVIDCLTARGWR